MAIWHSLWAPRLWGPTTPGEGLGDQSGGPAWPTTSGDQFGGPVWGTSLADHTGGPIWGTSLGDHPLRNQFGRRPWARQLGGTSFGDLAFALGAPRVGTNHSGRTSGGPVWGTSLADDIGGPIWGTSLGDQSGGPVWGDDPLRHQFGQRPWARQFVGDQFWRSGIHSGRPVCRIQPFWANVWGTSLGDQFGRRHRGTTLGDQFRGPVWPTTPGDQSGGPVWATTR